MLISVRNDVLRAAFHRDMTTALRGSRTYLQCSARLRVDVVLRLEIFAGQERPCLVDALGEELTLTATPNTLVSCCNPVRSITDCLYSPQKANRR